MLSVDRKSNGIHALSYGTNFGGKIFGSRKVWQIATWKHFGGRNILVEETLGDWLLSTGN